VIPWSMYHSGYRIKHFWKFLLKRIARLEPPYLFSLVLVIILLYAKQAFWSSSVDPELNLTRILLHIGYLIPFQGEYDWLNLAYWTLAIEFQYYLLIAILFTLLVSGGLFLRILIYALFLGFSYVTDSELLPFWLPVFLLGILMFLYHADIINGREFYITLSVVLLISIVKYPLGSVIYSIVPLLAIISYRNVKFPFFHYVGKFSYSIYLLHPLIATTYINVLSHYVSSPTGKFLLIISGIGITLVSAWISYLVIEGPSKRLSAGITYNK
jgi:peptidoglycan/LPS O-acetylase OafA/YrhL